MLSALNQNKIVTCQEISTLNVDACLGGFNEFVYTIVVEPVKTKHSTFVLDFCTLDNSGYRHILMLVLLKVLSLRILISCEKRHFPASQQQTIKQTALLILRCWKSKINQGELLMNHYKKAVLQEQFHQFDVRCPRRNAFDRSQQLTFTLWNNKLSQVHHVRAIIPQTISRFTND